MAAIRLSSAEAGLTFFFTTLGTIRPVTVDDCSENVETVARGEYFPEFVSTRLSFRVANDGTKL